MIKVGIVGGTGYTGQELARLLCRHPHVEIAGISARSGAGKDTWIFMQTLGLYRAGLRKIGMMD